MKAKAKLFGHPIHQMLIVLPLGLLAAAVISNAAYLWTLNIKWAELAFGALIPGGVITALIAAPFGTIDWLALPKRTRAWRVGAVHGAGNLLVVVIFSFSLWLHHRDPIDNEFLAVMLTFVGGALATFTGWLGGELVDQLGVGVSDEANLNAPNSLQDRVDGKILHIVGGRDKRAA